MADQTAHDDDNADLREEPSSGHGLLAELPADAIAEALLGDAFIQVLDAAHVPMRLMGQPVGCALGWLDAHGRMCRHPKQCQETPSAIRPLLTQRRRAREAQADRIHDALWRFDNSVMVAEVRAWLRKEHDDLVNELMSGDLFERGRLKALLSEGSGRRISDLAAALWSTGLEHDRTRALFKLLPAFIPREQPPQENPSTAVATAPEKERHRAKRLKLQARVTELEAQHAATKQNLRDRAAALTRATAEVTALASQLAQAEAARVAAQERIVELERTLRDEQAAAVASRRTHEKEVRRAADLENELAAAQTRLDRTEQEHAAVVRELAAARARIDGLAAELAALPRDRDAIADWLQREEERLNEGLLALQGGDRRRVEEEKRVRRKLEQAFHAAYPEYVAPRPVVIGETRAVEFRALGGGGEVGRSCYHLRCGPHSLLIDCGIAVGGRHEEDRTPDLRALRHIHALLLTHAHTDHIGWVPALVARLEDQFPIYCSRPTSQLLPIMLRDSRAHYERAMAEAQRLREYDPTAPPISEEYTADDVYDVETRLLEAPMSEPRNVAGTDLEATFIPAGHILGAASILIEGGGRRILFSGDISMDWQRTVGSCMLPEKFDPVDLLVLESTYGGRIREPAAVVEDKLISFVRQAVREGTALLPCFALGRAQEVAAILVQARKGGRLPSDLRIVVDGMIKRINDVYAENQKLDPTQLSPVATHFDRQYLISEILRGAAPPTAVVTTSGMLTGGPIVEWASRLLPDPRHRMALLGYQDEGAPGGALRKAAEGRAPYTLTLANEEGEQREVRVAAPVADIGLSAHADENGLIEYARRARPDTIVLVHGSEEAREKLRNRLIRERIGQDVLLNESLTLP